jgi:hypothetical protein
MDEKEHKSDEIKVEVPQSDPSPQHNSEQEILQGKGDCNKPNPKDTETETEAQKKKSTQEESQAERQRQIEEMEKNSTPFCFSKIIISQPWIILLIAFLIELICMYLFYTRDYMEVSKDDYQRAWLIQGRDMCNVNDARIVAHEELKDENQASSTALQSQEQPLWNIFLLYQAQDSNLFTTDNINNILHFEHQFQIRDDIDKFCLAEEFLPNNYICSPDLFQSSPFALISDSVPSLLQSAVDDKVGDMVADSLTSFFFGHDYYDNGETRYGRSLYKMAAPIKHGDTVFENDSDSFDKQNEVYEDFVKEIYDWAKDYHIPAVNVWIFGEGLIFSVMYEVLDHDLAFAIFSICIVFCYLVFHLQSFFLAICGMLQVIFAFPIGYAIYTDVFSVNFYDSMNILVIFVILGISADNFFVFTDAWTQALAVSKLAKDRQMRMAYTYRRAVKAMSVTTSTTAMAFLATATSVLIPISAFGIFAFTILVVNYSLTVTVYPCFLGIHGRFFEGKCLTVNNIKKYLCCCIYADPNAVQRKKSDEMVRGASMIGKVTDYGRIERFFNDKWNTWMHKLRIPLSIILGIWALICLGFATQINTLTEQEKWFPEDFYVNEAYNLLLNDFISGSTDTNVAISHFMWGVKGVNSDGTDKYIPNEIGTVIWDDDFQITTEEQQERFIEICDILDVIFQKIMILNYGIGT